VRRRVAIAAMAVAVVTLGGVVAFAQPVDAGLNLVCPVTPNPTAGQTVTCTYVAAQTTPPTTTTTSSTTTTVPSTTTTTTTVTTDPPPVTTTTTQPPSGFPTAATTGVPSGVALQSSGSFTTTADGQTIDARLIDGDLVLRHDNVTVTRSRIKGRVVDNGKRGLTLDQVDLGRDSCPSASNGGTRLLSGSDYTVRRSHLHHNGADLVVLYGKVRIEDSLLDGTCYYSGDHLDALQVYDTGTAKQDVTITRSSIDSRAVNTSARGNSALQIGDFPPDGSRYVLTGNRWAGGGYTLRLYDMTAASGSRITATGNQVVKGSYQYAPCVSSNSVNASSPDQTGLYWSNNRLDDGTSINC
jgi:hypothetical protein